MDVAVAAQFIERRRHPRVTKQTVRKSPPHRGFGQLGGLEPRACRGERAKRTRGQSPDPKEGEADPIWAFSDQSSSK